MRAEILVGPERRRRWSVAEKFRIIREAFAPGARVSDVARRRDVSRGQIYQWRAELRDRSAGAACAATHRRARARHSAAPRARWSRPGGWGYPRMPTRWEPEPPLTAPPSLRPTRR